MPNWGQGVEGVVMNNATISTHKNRATLLSDAREKRALIPGLPPDLIA